MDALARERTRVEPRHRSCNRTFSRKTSAPVQSSGSWSRALRGAWGWLPCRALGRGANFQPRSRPSQQVPDPPRLSTAEASRFSFADNCVKVRSGCARTPAITCFSDSVWPAFAPNGVAGSALVRQRIVDSPPLARLDLVDARVKRPALPGKNIGSRQLSRQRNCRAKLSALANIFHLNIALRVRERCLQ